MILIIQNGFIDPSITEYINEEYEIIQASKKDLSKIDLIYSIIIILGGHQDLTKISLYPYLIDEVNLIRKCLNNSIPIFGICLGAQLLAYCVGCKIEKMDNIKKGYDVNVMDYTNLYRNHINYIIPNENIEVIEYFENIPYIIKINNSYGIQFHVDISPDCIIKYTNHQPSIYYANQNKSLINKQNKDILYYFLNN